MCVCVCVGVCVRVCVCVSVSVWFWRGEGLNSKPTTLNYGLMTLMMGFWILHLFCLGYKAYGLGSDRAWGSGY